MTDKEYSQMVLDDMKRMYETALNIDLLIVSTDTAARILAVAYVHGNNEFMAISPKLAAEIKYIQERWHIKGGEVPDWGMVNLIQSYTEELELFEKHNPKERYPQWAIDLFKQRYSFKLIN